MDIGHGTIDVAGIKNGQPVPHEMNGRAEGIKNIHEKTCTLLENPTLFGTAKERKILKGFRMPSSLTYEDIDLAFKNGGQLSQSKDINLFDLTTTIRMEFAKWAVGQTIHQVRGSTQTMSGFVVTGGGAIVIGRELLEPFVECPLYIPDDPVMSIVRGFHILGSKL